MALAADGSLGGVPGTEPAAEALGEIIQGKGAEVLVPVFWEIAVAPPARIWVLMWTTSSSQWEPFLERGSREER